MQSGKDSFNANAVAALVSGVPNYSGTMTFTDSAAGDTFVATRITSVQVNEATPVVGPTGVNSGFTITGYALLNGATTVSFSANGSLPFPANAGSTGGLAFSATGANGFSFSLPWQRWDAGQSVTVTIAQPSVIHTSLQVDSSVNPSVYGQPVTFSAALSGGGTGSIGFSVDGVTVSTQPVDGNGQASYTTTSLAVGTHTIYATYLGDSTYGGSQAMLSQVTNRAAALVGLSYYGSLGTGQPLYLRAAVSAVAPGAGHPSGTVSFLDGSTVLGVVSLVATTSPNPGALAYLSLPTGLPPGTHSIHLVYSGDANFDPLPNDPLALTIAPLSTTTKLTSSLNPAHTGQAVTLTATLASTYPGNTAPALRPTGTVDFFNGTTRIGTGTVTSAGVATLTTTFSTAGVQSLSAVYNGDAGYSGSTGTLSETIVSTSTPHVPKVYLASSANPAVVGQAVTFSVYVSPNGGPIASMSGMVAYYDGSTLLGVTTLTNAQTSLTVSTLAAGSHTITAYYGGNATFTTANGSITQTINAPQPMSVVGGGTTLGGQVAFSTNVASTVTGGVPTSSGNLTYVDAKAGYIFSAVSITSIQVFEFPNVTGRSGVNGYFVIKGVARRNGSSGLFLFTATGSLPFPANAGSTGGLAFVVSGPNGFSYTMPWKPWDAGESIVMTLGN